MESRRDALVADIDSWLDAARSLGQALVDNAAEVERGRELIGEGAYLAEVVVTMSTAARFLRMQQALADFEAVRFALRSSLISTALAEGLTAGQLVDVLGVPPALTARVLDELAPGGTD